jgi:hypothetical protein
MQNVMTATCQLAAQFNLERMAAEVVYQNSHEREHPALNSQKVVPRRTNRHEQILDAFGRSWRGGSTGLTNTYSQSPYITTPLNR